ncbi:MAG TPA: hypothetical protein VGQ58_04235 [Candidatus Limnocylindrales bacterium]|jgi:hypothetical protein|nr:hypothetical protein [Candidatus Limnocylindrales bacterium]
MPKQYGTPGPRALYPDTCTSPSLAACDPLAQLLFDRLLVLADDQGRVQLDPFWVKANAFPLVSEATPRRIASWIGQLSKHELLIVYTAGRTELGQFVTWWKRQSGQRRAYPSRWPAPPGWDQDRTYGLPKDESPGARANPNRDRDAGTPRAERGHSAGKVRADRPRDAGKVPPSRAGFRAGADSGDSSPSPSGVAGGGRRKDRSSPRDVGTNPRATGESPRQRRVNPRANGTNPRALAQVEIDRIETAFSKGELSWDEAEAKLGRPPRQRYDHLAVTEDSFAVGPEPAEARR